MASFSYSGSLNTAALIVPNVYVVVVPPATLTIAGTPTNLMGVVGSASYGPINLPIVCGTLGNAQQNFGSPVARKYDLVTHVATAVQQGATAFTLVRVTDGTDTAATAASQTANSVVSPSFVAPFTGSGGAGTTVTISPGRTAGSWGATVNRSGRISERFDNNFTNWGALINAINSGTPTQSASQLVIAVTGSATIAGVPSAMTFTLIGGTDGATTVGPTQLIGQDGLNLSGAFCMRGQGCSTALASDLDATTYWPTLDALAQSEGVYWIHQIAAGTTVSASAAIPGTLGLSPWSKVMHGDWIYWYDASNTTIRLVSQQGFSAGTLANLGPQESSLNKPVAGVIGTQYTGQNGGNAYSDAQLQALFQVGIDLITLPSPGGNYWAARLGHNASTNPNNWSDSYPRLTTFLCRSLAAGMGVYVGQLISPTLLANVRASLLGFLSNLLQQGILQYQTDGTLPYKVVCDLTNNPQAREGLGYVQADVAIQYPGIDEKLILNCQGGPTVSVTAQ